MGRPIAQLKAEMSHREFVSWLAFYEVEPWGEERADLRAGIVASTVANCHVSRKGKGFKPSDFMPDFGKAAKRKTGQTREEQMAVFDTLKRMYGKAQ